MKSLKRFTTAAMQFCAAESELRALSIESRPCSEKELGNPMIGDFGILPCDVIDPEAERCANCQVRFANGPAYRAALNERQKAKKRMMRAFPRVKEEAIVPAPKCAIVGESHLKHLMIRYLGGAKESLTPDETEILLFALYRESLDHAGLAKIGTDEMDERLRKQNERTGYK